MFLKYQYMTRISFSSFQNNFVPEMPRLQSELGKVERLTEMETSFFRSRPLCRLRGGQHNSVSAVDQSLVV